MCIGFAALISQRPPHLKKGSLQWTRVKKKKTSWISKKFKQVFFLLKNAYEVN